MKQKIMKMEILVVVTEDFEDADHQIDDALSTIDTVVGVAATRTIAVEGTEEFDELPLYDDGAIWSKVCLKKEIYL